MEERIDKKIAREFLEAYYMENNKLVLEDYKKNLLSLPVALMELKRGRDFYEWEKSYINTYAGEQHLTYDDVQTARIRQMSKTK